MIRGEGPCGDDARGIVLVNMRYELDELMQASCQIDQLVCKRRFFFESFLQQTHNPAQRLERIVNQVEQAAISRRRL